eukprot:5949653-Amphidinium_carterae.1
MARTYQCGDPLDIMLKPRIIKIKSALTYCRYAMAGPLRKLMEVASSIKKGRFKPDLMRSGYIAGE